MRHFLIGCLLIMNGSVLAQQFPVGAFKMYNAVVGENPPSHSYQLTKTFPLYQDAGFNVGLPFAAQYLGSQPQMISDQEITELLDAASAHNVKILLPHLLAQYASVQRFYYEASTDYFGTVIGTPIDDNNAEDIDPPVFYTRRPLQATTANQYMVRDIKYQPIHQWYLGNAYRAYFRLKVSRPTSIPVNTPVVDIELRDLLDNTKDQVLTITSGQFQADDTYYLFYIDFNGGMTCSTPIAPPQMPGASVPLDMSAFACFPHIFDLRVKWHGQVAVWLDNIRVDGSISNLNTSDPLTDAPSLFSGSFNTTIKNLAKKFNAHPALARFYLKDEPHPTQFRAFDFVNKRLREAAIENGVNPSTGKGLGQTAMVEHWFLPGTNDPYTRAVHETAPFELTPDIYRFRLNDPLPGQYQYTERTQLGDGVNFDRGFETAIERFKAAQNNSIFTESGTWWYYVNIGRWTADGGSREPYLTEIYAQVNLALAYGAKGLMYFHYWSKSDQSIIGLIDPSTLDPINSGSAFSVYGENKWNGIKVLNQRLGGAFGTTLMGLTWQDAISRHTLTHSPSSPLNKFSLLGGGQLTNVTANGDGQNETYVEVGHLKNVSTSQHYLMVVNRRTGPSDSRDISLEFNNSTPWALINVETGGSITIGVNGTYTVNFPPGEGRLLKIVEAPAAPTANAATNVTSNSFTANWTSVSGVAGYRLDVSMNSDFSSFISGYPNRDVGNVTSFSVTGLNPTTNYYYRVRSSNSAGVQSVDSNVRNVTTLVEPPAAPILSSPSNGAIGVSTSPTLSWSASAGADAYYVWTSSGQGGWVYPPTTTFELSLAYSTTYYWEVTASNSGGQNSSGAWQFTTENPPPPPVYTISASAGSGGSISPSGSIQVTQGNNQTFDISPNTGYLISDVVINGGSYGVVWQYTFGNVTSNHTISASFVPCTQLGAPQWAYATTDLYQRIDLSWDFLSGNCAGSHFNIYRRMAGSGSYELVGSQSYFSSWAYEDYPPPYFDIWEYLITTVDVLGRESAGTYVAGMMYY